jgi:hypothetical protein
MFWTLATTTLSFLTGGIPKIIDYFQSKKDQSHELLMIQAQTERDLKMAQAGYLAQQKVEEIRLENTKIEAEAQERSAMYQHDIAIGQGASTWVINMRAMVRPTITYGLFFLLCFVDAFGFWYAFHTGVPFNDAMNSLWDDDTQTIWASVVSFWFGTQAFGKK